MAARLLPLPRRPRGLLTLPTLSLGSPGATHCRHHHLHHHHHASCSSLTSSTSSSFTSSIFTSSSSSSTSFSTSSSSASRSSAGPTEQAAMERRREVRRSSFLGDVTALCTSGRAPPAALWLGFGGLLPLGLAPAALGLGLEAWGPGLAWAQLTYGACLLAFLGGSRWGAAVVHDHGRWPREGEVRVLVTPAVTPVTPTVTPVTSTVTPSTVTPTVTPALTSLTPAVASVTPSVTSGDPYRDLGDFDHPVDPVSPVSRIRLRADWLNLGHGAVPPLLGWASLIVAEQHSLTSALLLQAMSQLVCLHYDTLLLPGYPDWYRGLRLVLSAAAILLLSSTAVMITAGNSSASTAGAAIAPGNSAAPSAGDTPRLSGRVE